MPSRHDRGLPSLRRALVAFGGCSALAAAVACGGGADVACRVDADCVSGRCQPDGTCAAPQLPDGADGGGVRFDDGGAASLDALAGVDGTSSDALDVAADATAAPTCKPNHDGRIDRAEVHFAAGLTAPFRASASATIDAKGAAAEAEARLWDLVGPFQGDSDVQVTTIDVAGSWYAKHFPGASYASRLALDADLLGVFEATGDALLLRGVVSPSDGLLRTRLVYDPPAQVLRFPLQKGASFASTSVVTGEKDGLTALWNESWVSVVDAHGVVKTPFGNFPTLRVRTTLTRKVGLLTYVTRSLTWAAECYGAVATARSKLDEPELDFAKPEELRRLRLP